MIMTPAVKTDPPESKASPGFGMSQNSPTYSKDDPLTISATPRMKTMIFRITEHYRKAGVIEIPSDNERNRVCR